MNFWNRLKSAAIVAWYGAYEAAKRSADRTYIPPIILEPHLDFDSTTRFDLISKCQYFERNDGLYNKICDVFEQNVCGPNGLLCIPASSDEKWNRSATESWNEAAENIEVTGQNMGCTQSLAARRWFVDGENFILKTRGKDGRKSGPSRPKIQLIESYRIQTPGDRYEAEGNTIFDGVQVDENGRPVIYWVRDGLDQEKFTPRLASDIIPISEPNRPGMLHGQPFATSVINTLIDLRNLQHLEMLAAKDAAEKSTIINTESGELDPATLRRQRLSDTTIDSAGNDVTTENLSLYRQILGARTIALKKGESATQFVSQRPSVAVQEYWEHLISLFCAGCGVSKQLVFPWSMQGTVVRADLDAANTFFRSRSSVIARASKAVYLYYMEWAIFNDPRLANPPADWAKVNVRYPRAVNVDVGRNSSAMLAELAAGATNFELIYAPLGLDAYEQLRKAAVFAKHVRDLAEEFDVTPGEISSHSGEAIALLAETTAAEEAATAAASSLAA